MAEKKGVGHAYNVDFLNVVFAASSIFLFLSMMSLPLKMLARWIFNLKYVVAIPEIFFNI